MADQRPEEIFELEDLANQPGTYVNPQTEVVVIVDDSASVDQDVFEADSYEGTEWVRISDEVPVDEHGLEEALEHFQTRFHPASTTAVPEDEDDDGPDELDADDDDDGPDPDPDEG